MIAKRYLAAAAAAVLAVSSIPSAFTANAYNHLPGDVNMDGVVGLQDVIAVRQYLDGAVDLNELEQFKPNFSDEDAADSDPTATPQLVDLAKALYRFAMEAAKA